MLCKKYLTETITLNFRSCSRIEYSSVTTIFGPCKYKLIDSYDENNILGVLSHTRVMNYSLGK